MGLSGRKIKQRIGHDPRNLTWADDASKFGQAYLSKLGWDPAKGLGVNGEGRTSHIKVHQKLNMMGIGAGAQQQGPDGIAWKQNREYEQLLARLNDGSGAEVEVEMEEERVVTVIEGSGHATSDLDAEEADVPSKKKKGKGDGEGMEGSVDGEDEEKVEKRRRKEERKAAKEKSREEKKERKKARKEQKGMEASSKTPIEESESQSAPEKVASSSSSVTNAPAPRPMAHRAKFLKSKKLAGVSSAAMAEILGVSGSATPIIPTPGSESITPASAPVPSSSATPVVPDSMQELTTSGKSVADYFKEKLAARSRSASVTPITPKDDADREPKSRDEEELSRAGIGRAKQRVDFADAGLEAPRVGLGMSKLRNEASLGAFFSLPSSGAGLQERDSRPDSVEETKDERITKSKKRRDSDHSEASNNKTEKKSKKRKSKDWDEAEATATREDLDHDALRERKKRKEKKAKKRKGES